MAEQNGHQKRTQGEIEQSGEPTQEGIVFRPRVDIVETPDELTLLVDVPGADPERIDVDFERGVLTLTAPVADRIPLGARLALAEYEVGGFRRSFRIVQNVDASAIAAETRNGVLVVHLPKAAEERPRKIPVLAG